MFIEPTPISSSAPLGARYISLLKELHSIGGAGFYKYFAPMGRKNACFKKAESGQGCPRSAARDGRAPCAAKSARRWYLKDGRKPFVCQVLPVNAMDIVRYENIVMTVMPPRISIVRGSVHLPPEK